MNVNIQLPDGDGGESTVELPMEAVYAALGRIEEIAIVNAHKAPELCSCFARAYATLTDHLSRISSEVVKAKNALGRRVAIVMLDEAPRVLREKGLISARSPGGSEDLRKSVLEIDVEYVQRRDRLQELEAWYELIKGKQQSAENGYLAVRKLLGGDVGYQGRNLRLGSARPEEEDVRIFSSQSVAKVQRPLPTDEDDIDPDLQALIGKAR